MRDKLLIFMTVVLLVSFAGCSNSNSYQKSLYNDDDKIAKQGDSDTFTSRVENTDENTLALSFKGFYGKQTIWTITAEEDSTLDLEINAKVDNGDFKICLINSASEVFIISENATKEPFVVHVPEGKNHIAIVGSNAKGEVEIKISDNEHVSLEVIE